MRASWSALRRRIEAVTTEARTGDLQKPRPVERLRLGELESAKRLDISRRYVPLCNTRVMNVALFVTPKGDDNPERAAPDRRGLGRAQSGVLHPGACWSRRRPAPPPGKPHHRSDHVAHDVGRRGIAAAAVNLRSFCPRRQHGGMREDTSRRWVPCRACVKKAEGRIEQHVADAVLEGHRPAHKGNPGDLLPGWPLPISPERNDSENDHERPACEQYQGHRAAASRWFPHVGQRSSSGGAPPCRVRSAGGSILVRTGQ